MEKLWRATNNRMELCIMRTYIFPTAPYGCETWTLNKNIIKCINAFEEKRYPRIYFTSIKDWTTNQSIAEELGVTSGTLLDFIKRQKLGYFRHKKTPNSGEIKKNTRIKCVKKKEIEEDQIGVRRWIRMTGWGKCLESRTNSRRSADV